jgi:small-conductance mechanosensitive channel/CRP-like cAMP-binding protein
MATTSATLTWVLQHGPWLLLTLLLLGIVYLRSVSSRAHIRTSLIMALILALVNLLVRAQPELLTAAFPLSVQIGLVDLCVGLLIIRVWGMILFKLLLPLVQLRPPIIIADITESICYLIWGAIRLHAAGVAVSDIVTTSAVLTAVIAFALQDTLGNLLAGIAIQLDDSIHVGDWIEHDSVVGRVSEINWRATSLETRNWETVVIPNSQLLKNRFMVLGKRHHEPVQWRRWVWFDLTLETLPTQIIQIIESALAETRIPNVAKKPAPNCVLMKVDNGIARYAVRYWLTDLQQDDPTDSAIRTQIDAALRRNERRLAPPIFNVLVTKEKQELDARHKRHTGERVRHLRQLSLFRMLSDDEIVGLADRLKFTPYVAGDIMLEQGQVAEWLYIMVSGSAEMSMHTPLGKKVRLGTLGTGDFFGEMGLLTGEASAFSLRAVGTVECYRVDRDMFQSVFLKRDELVSELSYMLQNRLKEQQLLLENHNLNDAAPAHGDLRGKLRAYFGLE